MIKEKLLKYRFFQFLVDVKMTIKRTFQKTRFLEKQYDKKSFQDFQKLVLNEEYIYEKEIEFLPVFLHNGDITIDIGANRGEYSYHLSKVVGNEGKVLAFEPGKRAFSILKMIKDLYNLENLHLFNMALTNTKGNETLIVPYFNRQSQLQSAKPIKGRKEVVITTTLDHILEEIKISQVSFIKCDTEGSEYLVFSGGIKTIEKFKPVIQVEIADLHTMRFGHCAEDVLNLLKGLGYSTFYYDYGSKKLIKTDVIELKTDGHVWTKKSENLSNNNYFFIHNSKINDFSELIFI